MYRAKAAPDFASGRFRTLSQTNLQYTIMAPFNRRSFLKNSGLSLLPAFLPLAPALAGSGSAGNPVATEPPTGRPVRFSGDGEMFGPADYLAELSATNTAAAIQRDTYGRGGAVEALEKKFAAITGKEKAIYMPSGTMANTFALSVLSGDNTKIVVPETSHVYRDEADAAQAVFGKRLIGLAAGEACFTAAGLQSAIDHLKDEEYLPGAVGAAMVELPNRRTNGTAVSIEEVKKISALCRGRNIPLHLDGARLFIASAFTGVPVREYAAHFDTVYISLYKYLGAAGGAILCGPASVIDKMPHLVKIHGGNMYTNWPNAAMALHRLEGFEARLQQAIAVSKTLFAALNAMPGVRVESIPGGTNIFYLHLPKATDSRKLRETLGRDHNIRLGPADAANRIELYVNETLLYQPADTIVAAFRAALA
ncbi:MAG: aminotransferase class I/II-fold pyridoxal phosphate-dependent enzyme [Chitinophagaceae bacterium]|nr:MAG: aminotransferase class I/II-fold pyridoxal phosphate-dependent enzyme [Chitinophagaceae bacterium]